MKKQILLSIFMIALVTIIFTRCTQTTTNGHVNVNGTSLYYEITGEGTPIVFLHGFTCDHRNWDSQVKYFSKKYRVITYDARGHGQSSMPDTVPYSYTDDLASLMDYLKIEKSVVVGHSMGGAPAFLYAFNHPDRVVALVLAEGGAFISDTTLINPKSLQDYFKGFSYVYNVFQKEGIEKAREAWLTINPIKTAAENPLSSELIKAMINDYSGWHWQNRDPQKRNPDGTPELMGKLKTPTLIITGDLSHEVIKELVSAYDTFIPNSKKVILSNSNHMLNLENPDQFNQELMIFLKENNIN
ncbi:MAG: alpha/beta hydrolase [Bacteroidales bacterium]|jgi:pimeloyl-ACP methyl ester carboxylesterase|nr:alpha/beta hydrolase [Bacteroidales bacterium]